MKIRYLFKQSTTLVLLLFSLFSMEKAFSEGDPVQMLRQVTNQVMNELRANREEFRTNTGKLNAMVNRMIVPHVDFVEMARWVVGRTAWNAANEASRKAFVHELQNLVVRTYASSLLNFKDQEIVFFPNRGSVGGKNRIQVSSEIRQNGKAPIRVSYYLTNSAGSWKVYDIIIEGVSLMQGYRSQFAEAVNEAGLEGALEKMKRHNSRAR